MQPEFVERIIEEMSVYKAQYEFRRKQLVRYLKENINKVQDKSNILLKLDEYLQKKRPIKNDSLLAFGVQEIIEKVYGGSYERKEEGKPSKDS